MTAVVGAGGAGAGGAGGAGAGGGMAAGGKIVGGIGQLAGGLANVYGAYKGAQMAQKQFDEDKRRYENQLMRMREMDAISKYQMGLGNTQTFQQMAEQKGQGLQETYGNYNRTIGR